MKYIRDLTDGSRINEVYFCKGKTAATTKNGKTYYNVSLQDKTGSIDGKIWDVTSSAINEFEAGDYVDITGDVSVFAGSLQVSIRRLRKAEPGQYSESDYMPVSRYSIDSMYEGLMKYASSVENEYLRQLINMFFVEDQEFIQKFKYSSAAKSIHHSFIGGLLEHTVGVVGLCHVFAKTYTFLNRDLLITAAMFHDIGKTREISPFPANDYTDEGQFLGHIMIGYEMIHEAVRKIDGFPVLLEQQLKHCILSHHGELEYGSPKKPSIAEAVALSMADLTDARMESFREAVEANPMKEDWLGFSKIFEANISKTKI